MSAPPRVAVLDGTATISLGREPLQVRFPRQGQVSLGFAGALAEPSYAVVAGLGSVDPEVERLAGGWLVQGPGIAVVVHDDGRIEYRDGAGHVVRRDAVFRDGSGWSLRSGLDPGETVHGLGGRTVWNLRGGIYRCWNSDPGGAWVTGDDPLYVTTPVWLVLGDGGAVHCFIDNPWDGSVDITGDQLLARFTGGPMRWHVSIGTLPEVVESYTALTGRPAVPPGWALGHHQARWGYGSRAEVQRIWEGFRDHGLPLSALHLDIDHMDRFRNFTFGAEWDGIEDLIAAMAQEGVRTVVILDAGLASDDPRSRDAADQGLLCRNEDGSPFVGNVWPGATVFPDFTDPRARRWWGEQLAFYADRGVAGYWHDMNEPVCFEEAGEATFPLATRHDLDGRPGDHRAAHNVYGLQMCRASYEGLRRLQPQRRPFLFSRSGWAGTQRFGGHWSGDIHTEWSSLRATIAQALGFGASGIGFYGSDIGGFSGDPSPELFTRWFQLVSFLPLFRTHCSFVVPRREPWEWGPEVLQHVAAALHRRSRLLPLWYTLALSAARDGAPYVRPLAWLDPRAREVDDMFLVGPDVLVAPVLEPGATLRRVDLPGGTWYHGETGEVHTGSVELSVGLGDTPWFVRAGAVLPSQQDDALVLLVAPPEAGSGSGSLLTDAGDGWDPPHEERYTATREGSATKVRREVLQRGAFGFTAVSARALDGSQVVLR